MNPHRVDTEETHFDMIINVNPNCGHEFNSVFAIDQSHFQTMDTILTDI